MMNRNELITIIKNTDIYGSDISNTKVIPTDVLCNLLEQLDEPVVDNVDNLITILRRLEIRDRRTWLNIIMRAFTEDIDDSEYNRGYTDGNLDSVFKVDNKVIIPDYIADWIMKTKPSYSLSGAMKLGDQKINKWLSSRNNQEKFARAWLDGYNINPTKYVVTDGNNLYFKCYQEDVYIVILADKQPGTMKCVKKFDTKEEAQKVADVLGWNVYEVK